MKTIYLDGNKFEWNTIKELKEEAKKYNITIGDGCLLENNCELGVNCKLGDFCLLENNCELGVNCKLGDFCLLGHDCELGVNCKLGDFCLLVHDCELGVNCKLGNRTKVLENTRLNNHIYLSNHYRYTASGYIDKRTNKPVIQLGCLVKFADEYKFGTDEFYTNEFKKGTKETKKREEVFKLIKMILEKKE